ncbi:KAP family P-loop NTPase fold protein [Marinirhabdus gelatinilytica]|uniref:KAP-like P-loop domain-containing protein n=1 Tax=Marinirhabdus gelatinilytica TaxID=1703343 RepID=A0A370QIS2_9FLAO|nr:P-loop NTPase fold protein [Marinirhabdus gelatinilytica]RDK88258.1 KAP-like P-loop domain-containing protein [Marinirhabdus gelatinilytica]
MSKLLPNLPIEDLTPENDYLGIIETGNIIKSFLINNKDEFSQIKMFSLYGEWGSGKSTLMKYLKKELKSDFNTYFFEAWEYESDDNLSLSMLEFLLEESNTISDKLGKELRTAAENLLEGFTKSITLHGGIISFSGEKLVSASDKNNTLTFYQKKKDFKNKFKKWENKITSGTYKNTNMVFIDDLDRCEPENVLNLLSALKLFFTYGKKTIFICGVDKKAVHAAINNKYGNAVKSKEYLEKIFDIPFHIPKYSLSENLFNDYFHSDKEYRIFGGQFLLPQIMHKFFSVLRFENPRKIKKVLNRFLIIRNILEPLSEEDKKPKAYPNIINNNELSLFDLLLTVYFVILKEFHPEKLENIQNYKLRKRNYTKAYIDNLPPNSNTHSTGQGRISQHIFSDLLNEKFISIKKNYNNLVERDKASSSNSHLELISKIVINFAPINPQNFTTSNLHNIDSFRKSFLVKEKDLSYYFTYFLLSNLKYLLNQEIESENSIFDIITIINRIP